MIEIPDLGLLGWALVGLFLLFAFLMLVLVAYLLYKRGSGSVTFEKKIVDGNSVVLVQPFMNLKRIMVQDKAGGESLVFVRENVSSGEKVYFEYPASRNPARLTTEGDLNVSMEAKPS
jgi:hypothetical protein